MIADCLWVVNGRCSWEPWVCRTCRGRLQLKPDGTRWRTVGEVKGKHASGVDSQYSSHYLGTWCIQHYYRWCAPLGCQQSTELTPPVRFKWTGECSGQPVLFTLPRNMVYPALLPLMRTPRLPVVDWTDASAGRFKGTRPFRWRTKIWFVCVCHHISNAVYRTSALSQAAIHISDSSVGWQL